MITYTALTPHPPLIVPSVGGNRINEVASTVQAMKSLAKELAAESPQTLVVLTPHGNVFSDCITCLSEAVLYGDFKAFGSQAVGNTYNNDRELLVEISKRSVKEGINFINVDMECAASNRLRGNLDHGVLVPMHYVEPALDHDIRLLPISTGLLSNLELYTLGKIIQESAAFLGRRVAIIASGDMSHRLKNEGPYDYHPDGQAFDLQVKELLAAGDVRGILKIPAKLRDNAGECGYRSIVIMLGTLDGLKFESQVFSYEGPFGVGYLVAGFRPFEEAPSLLAELKQQEKQRLEAERRSESEPVKWARMVLESYIQGGKIPNLPPELDMLNQKKAGVFVSLKKNGQLRGCIGTIAPVYDGLAQEIAANAISSGTRDARFFPLEQGELEQLTYSVDILGEAEECSRQDLDPARYGVIVSKAGKRGLLLPDLEGVDTVDQQLQIALEKGGISPGEKYKIERFEVRRYR
ncbi:putative acr [hydrocarbon metagenome]|uniref:Putative acr n=1 Tax=hydrocarbon metagenome TaxID=938273 RepID=A0A0W8E698_9ZZZZ